MLANRAVEGLDRRLEWLAATAGWTYTRYADDLAFSKTEKASRGEAIALARRVELSLEMNGLLAHRQKTSIATPHSRKVLLGMLVDTGKPRLTKAFRNNIDTHLYALTHEKIGAEQHRSKRGFSSIIGMRRHIMGLIAHANQVDETYAATLYARVNCVNWEA